MAKIITCTLNPALDVSTSTAEIIPDDKLRCDAPVREAGGGGINVSRALKRLGVDSIAIYTKGGAIGALLKELISKDGFEQVPIETKQSTRENFSFQDEKNKALYRFVLPGPELTKGDWQQFIDKLSDYTEAEYVVASGSLSPGVPDDFYAQLAKKAKSEKQRFVLDTSGNPLKQILKSGAYLIKPNRKELGELLGQEPKSEAELIKAAEKLIKEHAIEVVVVSLGPDGAILATQEGTEKMDSPSIKRVESAIGAGDSMVAGIVLSLSQGKSIREAVRYGLACGSAALLTPGTELLYKEDADRLLKKLDV